MFSKKSTSYKKWTKRGFPFYQQHEMADCGPACLRMIAEAYGRKHSLQYLREVSNISRRGVNLRGIGDAAESIGLRTLGIRTTFDKLCKKATLPCIVHWRQVHFAVVYRIDNKIKSGKEQTWIYVADPAHGMLKYTADEFRKNWITTKHDGQEKGVAMLLEPTPYFYQRDTTVQQPMNLKFLIKYLKPYKKLMTQILWGMIAACALQMIFPFLTQSIVDHGIDGRNLKFIYLVLIAQLGLVLGRASIDFIRRWILLHISTRINVSLISDFLTKLMRLPMKYFDSKMTGDLILLLSDKTQ